MSIDQLATSDITLLALAFLIGIRYAGLAMCSVFLIGLFALPFAPETKGKPLPEETDADTVSA